MEQVVLALFGIALAIGALAVALVLPIVAIVQIRGLKQSMRTLRLEVRRLREERAEEVFAPPEPKREPERKIEKESEREQLTIREAEVVEDIPRPAPSRKSEPDAPDVDWSKVEAWLGVRGLGWAAVVLLVFTGGFFLKVVFERGLISEIGKIAIGGGLGEVLCLAGWRSHRRGRWIFSQMLTSAAIALFYLSAFASFGYYHIVPQRGAAPFLILLVAEAFALAALYNAPAIAIMAVVGGLLTPVLLHSDVDQYRSLFSYLVILDTGVVVLSLFRRWWVVTTLALVGTHALFWGWYTEQYHPAKLSACLVFHGAIFALYLGQAVLVQVWRKKPANIEELIRQPLLAVLVSTAGYWLLDTDFHQWLGSIALGLASVYALLAALVNRQLEHSADGDQPLLYVYLALAMAFLAAVFPLEAQAAWIAVGWAVEGLVLWWFGLRVRQAVLHGMGMVFLLLGMIRLLFVDTLNNPVHNDVFIPIFNSYGLPATIVSLCILAAALLQRRARPEPGSSDFALMRLAGVAGVVLLWIVCSIETYDFFIVQGKLSAPGVQARLTQQQREMPELQLQKNYGVQEEHLHLLAQMSLSAVWAGYALALLAIGLRLENRPLRWLGLGLFAVTLGKVMLVDTKRLDGLYRVGAFFALSLMMAAGAWAYQKLRRVLADHVEKEHEPVA